MGKAYSITYCDKPSEVDIHRRESLWGQVDYWTRSIRLWDGDNTPEDLLQALLHEVLHIVEQELHFKVLISSNERAHDEIDLIALVLTDVLTRNGWLRIER